MARDGSKSGGRPPGAIGRKSLEAVTILRDMGCNSLQGLAEIAMGKPFPSGELPTSDQILTARKELIQYEYPKLKAMEHSGSVATHEDTLEALGEE